MCVAITRVFYCMRCTNDIYEEIECQECPRYHQEKRCGKTDLNLSFKCEADLCILCASFPPESQVPFMSQPPQGSTSTIMRHLRLTLYNYAPNHEDDTEPNGEVSPCEMDITGFVAERERLMINCEDILAARTKVGSMTNLLHFGGQHLNHLGRWPRVCRPLSLKQ
ncbi:hypothetical protein FDENT_4672 [Fusarium denticulatum]|uniref:Uncharacterized protein n=1 Tax=Fusarium denticulatum TaxID=48507 RepID=A0A8H5X9N3_9HYPO|nr:hypothetical protein FDENT_4672 [Fusarium denticulatum]